MSTTIKISRIIGVSGEGANGLVCTRDLAFNSVLSPTDEYKELKDFYDKVAAGDAQPAILKDSLHERNN